MLPFSHSEAELADLKAFKEVQKRPPRKKIRAEVGDGFEEALQFMQEQATGTHVLVHSFRVTILVLSSRFRLMRKYSGEVVRFGTQGASRGILFFLWARGTRL